MGCKRKKKGESGEVKRYITRNAAVKKLQLSLRDFRKICILKGIYPREPKNRKKVQKGDSTIKTLYYMKDIQFLLHEPIIWKFREHRAFTKKIKRAKERNESEKADNLIRKQPIYRLDHIVRERYPTFVDALQDIDDPLTLCSLFAKMPRVERTTQLMLDMCRRLTLEFMLYVIEAQALRKVFIALKGYYYQVEIMGQTITWIMPHPFTPQNVTHVDFRIMKVFVEFYVTLLGFTNFRLYHSLNLHYPPKLPDVGHGEQEGLAVERLASLNFAIERNHVEENDEEEEGIDMHLLEEEADHMLAAKEEEKRKRKQQSLFKGFKFFLNRETNIESLTFVIRACQGKVSWDESTADGSTFPSTDESITHEIVDRPDRQQKYLSRYYIQPQWVYDCINARLLLPVQDYFPGASLPPHLSPFDAEADAYVPPEQEKLMARQRGEIPEDEMLAAVDSEDSEDEEDGRKKKKKKEEVIRPLDSFRRKRGKKEKRLQKAMEAAKEEAALEKSKEPETPDGKEASSKNKNKEVMEENKKAAAGATSEDGKLNGKAEEAPKKPRPPKPMKVHKGTPSQPRKGLAEKQELEEKKLAIMMIPRKKKRLFHILRRQENRKAARVRMLTEKRKSLDHAKKLQKQKEKKELANKAEAGRQV